MYNEYIEHSAKGSHWTKKNHKYIRKEGNRYIYDDDQKKAARERNFFKGHKLVDKNLLTGKTERSSNAQKRSFERRALINHRKFINDADNSEKKFIKQANDDNYKFLKSVDDEYYKAVKEAKKMEDPKAWKSLIKQANKMNVETLKMLSKEYTDNSLRGRLAKRRISKLEKQLNSKSMNLMENIVSRVAAKLTKAGNKKHIKELDRMRKISKASANAQHKAFINQTKKDHAKWKFESDNAFNKWANK